VILEVTPTAPFSRLYAPLVQRNYLGEPFVKTRPLGSTGYRVGEIGFGGWGLGADMWRGVDETQSRDALRQAVDQGITFFDTALAYGSGHSERLIGQVLKDEIRAGRAHVATKVPPRNLEWPGKADKPLAAVFSARHIAACTETSLKNLGVDAIHLQQLHVWHDAWLDDREWPKAYDQMARLTKEGKVLHWGISINDHAPETALRVLADPLFETAQVIYNIYDRSPERALFALAQTKPLGIIVRVPFDEGALTGGIRSTTVFPAGDWREGYFRGDRRAEVERRGKALAALLDHEVETLPELALRFCLSSPAVSTVIPGMRRPAHVQQNVAAAVKGPLKPEMLARLEAHAWEKNWYPD
jgi:aryl-alcohol dehydrogenase-like predicted oxidoreductase